MKIYLDNKRNVPMIRIIDDKYKERATIFVCKDGCVIETDNESLGTNIGSFSKKDFCSFKEANDINNIHVFTEKIKEKASKDLFKDTNLITYANKVSANKDGSFDLEISLSKIIEVHNTGVKVRESSEGGLFVPFDWIYSWSREGKMIYNSLFDEERLKKVLAYKGRWGKSELQREKEAKAWNKQQEEFKKLIEESREEEIRGLYGCSSRGVITTPSGKFLIWLPPFLAFRFHTFLNRKHYAI